MGKNSESKRKRRSQSRNSRKASRANQSCVAVAKQLSGIFGKYSAEDVAISLEISELWLPNISSQVKHAFGWIVFAAMGDKSFTSSKSCDTYDEFCNLLRSVYPLLPKIPFLEDYIPEPDWGEIRIHSKGTFPKIFYGGNVERIPDFIEAFRLTHESNEMALEDMDIVISLQNEIIASVSNVGIAEQHIEAGHLELPSESFWHQLRQAILSATDKFQELGNALTPALVTELGISRMPKTWQLFGDGIMEGTLIQTVAIRVNGKTFPISLRNTASVVIDFWAEKQKRISSNIEQEVSSSVSRYISRRIDYREVFPGPFQIATQAVSPLPYWFAGVIQTKKQLYFLLIVSDDSLNNLSTIERNIKQLLDGDEQWAIVNRRGLLFFERKDGSAPISKDIVILAIPTQVSTSAKIMRLSDVTARVMWLPDLVTVFDSLNDAEELDTFWDYINTYDNKVVPMAGTADRFASFRDSHALLVDGAFEPTLITLDPHWGSSWRYRELSAFWHAAPSQFPNDSLAWRIDVDHGNLKRLLAKNVPILAWSTTVGQCSVHVVFDILENRLDLLNGRMLEQLVHCLADAMAQRSSLIKDHGAFAFARIVIRCHANDATLAGEVEAEDVEFRVKSKLLDDWKMATGIDGDSLFVTVGVNLSRVQSRLLNPVDAEFEVECVLDAMEGIAELIGEPLEPELPQQLRATSSSKPRFYIKQTARTVDVPEYSNPQIPESTQYKIARRDLAIILKNQGLSPGRYELGEAKVIIDRARDDLRTQVHSRIDSYDRQVSIMFCIRQHDALAAEYRHRIASIRQSLEHEVTFDRSDAAATALERFKRNAQNYRYLLEYCLSSKSSGTNRPGASDILQTIAYIDWLFVFYGASDVLHNDIEVTGVEINQSFIPEVYYSADRQTREHEFSLEQAKGRLGIDLSPEDEVRTAFEEAPDWKAIDDAFLKDLGFSLTHLAQVLLVLGRWQQLGGEQELQLSYEASATQISELATKSIEGLSAAETAKIIEFATLDASRVRSLLGKEWDEDDVPVWEHNKRSYRYTIRPLVEIKSGVFAWGAANANRASSIWTDSVLNGYLPADFDWPHVKAVVRAIKEELENQLETQAHNVCSRATTQLAKGIDLMRRFPKEKFEDVGDFDVLAYLPSSNQWLNVECKYNQPPYCLKDARRLRDRIFGAMSDGGQFAKIARRRSFLSDNLERLRTLLNWPEPEPGSTPKILEVYVSRDTYWWMRNPPITIPTHFVRIDALDGWLRANGLLGSIEVGQDI